MENAMGNPTRMSDACRRAITEPSEGKRLKAYRDCVGVWTIGYGHTSRAGPPAVRAGQTISEQEADAILSNDLRKFESGVAALLSKARAPVAQCEFDALVDLAFNIGLGAFKSSSLLHAYLSGDKAEAADRFLQWNKAGGRVVAGLTARRRRERAWFVSGHSSPDVARHDLELARKVDKPDALALRAVNLLQTKGTDVMKGYRTIAVGLMLAIGPAALQYLGAIDWAQLIGPTGAFFASGLIAIAMRAVTTTPVGRS
jgi:lysozyme